MPTAFTPPGEKPEVAHAIGKGARVMVSFLPSFTPLFNKYLFTPLTSDAVRQELRQRPKQSSCRNYRDSGGRVNIPD